MTSNPNQPIQKLQIAPRTGAAFILKQGQVIRITDLAGEQVADLFCVSAAQPDESLSAGHTLDYNQKIFFSTGDILYSSRSNPMLRIVADRVGQHMMLYAPCSQEMFARSYGVTTEHPNCYDNLAINLSQYDVQFSPGSIPLNIFMRIEISQEGEISILPPCSKAGDYIDLKAEMDLVVGVAACSAGACNNFTWTPIEVAIYPGSEKETGATPSA